LPGYESKSNREGVNRVFQKILCCLAVIAALGIGAVVSEEKKDGFTADRHKSRGLSCIACHKEEQPKTAAPAQACLACHKSIEAVAVRTKDFTHNPHDNHMTGSGNVECTQCHQGHKEDTLLCTSCHSGMTLEKEPASTE
jgi:hypothetical protein